VTATLLDGRALAADLRKEVASEVAEFVASRRVTPKLVAILVGEDPASEIYVRNKRLACQQAGIADDLRRLPASVSTTDLLAEIDGLNRDPSVHGILVQTPLPQTVDTPAVLHAVAPVKDVDAFHPENVGLLVQGQPRFLPCTPHGIRELLLRNEVEIRGRHVVIVGRSDIVGKPMANMFLQRGAGGDATVTVCHSRTQDLASHTRQADILVAAIGRPKFITADMLKPGVVVVDVGMNRTEAGLAGDVDFEPAAQVASKITPVPGGVGPLTVAMLLRNTLRAAQLQSE
jgi:methylenetetrahydrofolate dehydrogenase (NADP+)/methenyltetrahydrofolate cyclohydrolase